MSTLTPNASSKNETMEKYAYLRGLGNYHRTEAKPETLPNGQNSPQQCAHGLYAEQLSGTAFTAPRYDNQRRILPSVRHDRYLAIDSGLLVGDFTHCHPDPNQIRWMPPPIPELHQEKIDFSQGWRTMAGAGNAALKNGIAIHIYITNIDMSRKAMYNADGDLLIVPQFGKLDIKTEFGRLEISPGEILVIPRNIYYTVQLVDGPSRGYILEVFNGHFKLPELGPIGANSLANPQDFLIPVAYYDKSIEQQSNYLVVSKYLGRLFEFQMDHSPFNVVGWHGNYYPYKYNLNNFVTIGSISFDHPDPSIFTVLTCPTTIPGTAAADFVIFPPRWLVQENTFRPPYYHRNVMNEYMGLIQGVYDAKSEGFLPGGSSLHSGGSAHGPDKETFEKETNKTSQDPIKLEHTMAFMFETIFTLSLTKYAQENYIDKNYPACWKGLKSYFKE